MKNKVLDPIAEAERYLQNADDLLKNYCTIDNLGHYSDAKYVRMAGHTAWTGILIALDPLHPDIKKSSRKSVDTYRKIFEQRHRKYMNVYNSAYSELHLSMGYDGNTHKTTKIAGWESAKMLINWAKVNAPKVDDKDTKGLSGTKKTAAKSKAKTTTTTKKPKK